jgi:polyhydroxyalkanoate synthase
MTKPEAEQTAKDGAAPNPRLGPRPLPLHLMLAVLNWQGSKVALPLLSHGSLPWKAPLSGAAEDLRNALGEVEAGALRRAVEAEADARFRAFLTGVQAYREHPYRRHLSDPPAIWREGASQLLDYGGTAGGPSGGGPSGGGRTGAGGTPLLVVPSLINRAYILDLKARVSLVRWLAKQGFRPFLLDWGRPGEAERAFSLTDYVAGRLERALDAVLAETGAPPRLVGYCMGGLLALALALRREEDLSGLVLLGTPWDFHAEQAAQAGLAAAGLAPLAPLIDAQGELPVAVIQGLFASLDPLLAIRKFAAFSALDPADSKAELFVAVEDWINDGVPLAGPVARECLGGWYGDNATAAGRWRIAGQAVLPARVRLPVLCIVPGNDSIVPPASAMALAEALPTATVRTPPVGHVGMVVSAAAARRVWRPMADWLAMPRADP